MLLDFMEDLVPSVCVCSGGGGGGGGGYTCSISAIPKKKKKKKKNLVYQPYPKKISADITCPQKYSPCFLFIKAWFSIIFPV